MLSACNTSYNPKYTAGMCAVNTANHFLLQVSQDKLGEIVRNMDIKSKIMDQYADWKGVHYRLGGNSKRGIDCSAFVQTTSANNSGLTYRTPHVVRVK